MTAYNAKYKTGDIVRLRSGGPPMTVQHMESSYAGISAYPHKDPIPCVWMDEHGVCHEKVFAAEAVGP